MAVEYANQVTVRIWRNIKTRGFIPTAHFGHASVELRHGRERGEHISFWPGKGGAGMGKSAFRSKTGTFESFPQGDKRDEMGWMTQIRLEVGWRMKNNVSMTDEEVAAFLAYGKSPLLNPRGQNRWEDEDGDFYWSQSPEVKVKLPALKTAGHLNGQKDNLWGLSSKQVERWWAEFKPSEPHYRALSRHNNCAGVALMALEAGGAGAFLPLPTFRIYAEPMQVERYAQSLLSVLQNMDVSATAIDQEVREAVLKGSLKPATGAQADGLWTVAEWKKQSALGPFQPRSGTIRGIDEALERFHAATWTGNHPKKFAALVQVFRGLSEHRQQKATSARSASVLGLAAQVIALVRNIGPLHA